MAEATITAYHVATLTGSKGRGLKILGFDIQPDTNETLTTGLSEISGAGHVVEDAAVDAATALVAVQVSAGTITFEVGEIDTYGALTGESVRVLVMGVLR